MIGFVTLAVGDDYYYKLAANLLRSYRLNGNCDAQFVIFADRENKYTAMFDKVILIENPKYSYLDKLEILHNPPFEHNIFIDADCLIYNDVSILLENAEKSGVHCFGKKLELTSQDGWFLIDDIGEYKEMIDFIPSMHGGIIFFSSGELTNKIYMLAMQISNEYSKYRFKYFNNPADEPILALSTAVYNCPPIELSNAQLGTAYCFLPAVKNVQMNIRKKKLTYTENNGAIQGEQLFYIGKIKPPKSPSMLKRLIVCTLVNLVYKYGLHFDAFHTTHECFSCVV